MPEDAKRMVTLRDYLADKGVAEIGSIDIAPESPGLDGVIGLRVWDRTDALAAAGIMLPDTARALAKAILETCDAIETTAAGRASGHG